jgi:hypothetical protein
MRATAATHFSHDNFFSFEDERAMNFRSSRLATAAIVVAALVLMTAPCWAVFYALRPSKDDWGLKYDVQVSPAEGDKLKVEFTLIDDGRLKPVYSVTLIALSKQTDSQGGHSYDVKAPIELKPNASGGRSGQVQIGKQFADRALFRVLTLTIDGKPRPATGAAYYAIPLKKHLKPSATAVSP